MFTIWYEQPCRSWHLCNPKESLFETLVFHDCNFHLLDFLMFRNALLSNPACTSLFVDSEEVQKAKTSIMQEYPRDSLTRLSSSIPRARELGKDRLTSDSQEIQQAYVKLGISTASSTLWLVSLKIWLLHTYCSIDYDLLCCSLPGQHDWCYPRRAGGSADSVIHWLCYIHHLPSGIHHLLLHTGVSTASA